MVQQGWQDGPGKRAPRTGEQRWALTWEVGDMPVANATSRPALESPAQDLMPGRATADARTRAESQHPGAGPWQGWRPTRPVFLLQKEERTMLEDLWVTLSELDNVAFSFKQLDENYVASE